MRGEVAKFYYGGQAVLEGVMMRGRKHMAVAVRRPDGEIVTYDEPLAHYEARRREIVTIITGFRNSRYEGAVADRMENRLMALQDGMVVPAVA